jgi:hypothetical protein
VHMQLPTSRADFSTSLARSAMLVIEMVLPRTPVAVLQLRSTDGVLGRGPANLLGLCAGDRLVRTSRALLI